MKEENSMYTLRQRKRTNRLLTAMVIITTLILSVSIGYAGNPYPTNTTANCTWYAWQKVYNTWGIELPKWGNGGNWYNAARNSGWPTGTEAKVDSLVCWSGGDYGHVAYVIDVNDTQIKVVEGGRPAYSGSIQEKGEWAPKGVGTRRWANDNHCSYLLGYIYLKSTVTFNANGGTGGPGSMIKLAGQVPRIPDSIPTRSGYTFVCWNSSSDGSGQYTLNPGDTWGGDFDITYYAIWKQTDYTITYDANGGTGAPGKQTVIGGGSTKLSTTVPKRTGYVFLGWNTSKTATTVKYKAGETYPGGTVTLYAIWKIKTYTVSFNSNGAGIYDSVAVKHGSKIGNLPQPVRAGYLFDGWFDTNSNEFTLNTTVTSNLTLTARWTKTTCVILPENATTVESEAFYGVKTNAFVIPPKVVSIGSKAFANNNNLYSLIVYSKSVTPASDAFDNCPKLTIYGYPNTPIYYYAVAKDIPFIALKSSSEWVSYSEMPVGAPLLDEKWTYTEEKRSTAASISGWTLSKSEWQQTGSGVSKYADFPAGFSKEHTLYKKYNPADKKGEKETSTAKTVLGKVSNAGYVYWHWTLEGDYEAAAANAGHAINVYVWNRSGTDSDGWTYTRFHAFETDGILQPVYGASVSGGDVDYSGQGLYSTCYHPTYNLANYISYWWYIIEINEQPYTEYQKVNVFTRNGESATVIQPGNGIKNVKHMVRYGF